ncbi:PD-(D/E)XK nuclease family protein [Clostridium cochlearium]|uniref:PD-(D/E)XK nuclease family protein n=1 Tax=Clostridium cochlearium TaxID=1494 RepID=A0A7Y4DEZ2_CLOCO|nr:PD-(D/E)XK nuclease family protein [Clostridium cochlearium]NOH17266.1 PD-(D/E)XK nuclease family protein [Clostridium cochlearium]
MNKEEKQTETYKIAKYFSELQFRINIYNKAKKETDVYLASDFNVFDYINPNENKLSDIIANLLDPNGTHGQKDTFLKEFLKIIDKKIDYDLMDCRIVREDPTTYIQNNQRIIDITINFENKFEIGIENKTWDKEQENQLQDYQKHLRKKYGENFCIIYISGDGSEPESLSLKLKKQLLKENKLIILKYKSHIKNWLDECYKECKSEKIRIFINDFINYVEQNFEDLYEDLEEN